MRKHNNNEESEVVEQCTDAIINVSDIAVQLTSALTVDSSNYFVKLDDGKEISRKEYTLINPVGKKDKLTIFDMSLIESMEKINMALKGREILSFVIAKEVSRIAKTDKFKSYGFKSIADFAKAIYGFESSTTNHYVRIGNAFINDDYSLKAGLPNLGISHLVELNSLVDENGSINAIIDLYVNGKLTDGMSTKVIREAIKNIKDGITLTDNLADATQSTATTDVLSANTSTKVEVSTDSEQSDTNEINIDNSFDNKVAIAQILGHCNSIEAIIEIMERNDIFIDGIKKALSDLRDNTKRIA